MRILTSIFTSRRGRREGRRGGWRKLRNGELHNLKFIKYECKYWGDQSRRKRWMWHAADMGEIRNVYNILITKLKRTRHLEDLGVEWSILFKFVLNK